MTSPWWERRFSGRRGARGLLIRGHFFWLQRLQVFLGPPGPPMVCRWLHVCLDVATAPRGTQGGPGETGVRGGVDRVGEVGVSGGLREREREIKRGRERESKNTHRLGYHGSQ